MAGDTSWTAPTLLNSWAQVAGSATVGFRKDAQGFVHFRGRVAGGVTGSTLFNLPAGYRPGGGTVACPSATTDASDAPIVGNPGFILITTAGVVSCSFQTGTARIGFDDVTFYAEN